MGLGEPMGNRWMNKESLLWLVYVRASTFFCVSLHFFLPLFSDFLSFHSLSLSLTLTPFLCLILSSLLKNIYGILLIRCKSHSLWQNPLHGLFRNNNFLFLTGKNNQLSINHIIFIFFFMYRKPHLLDICFFLSRSFLGTHVHLLLLCCFLKICISGLCCVRLFFCLFSCLNFTYPPTTHV